jgi:ribosomal protein S18 acetylase RimI-like enzyme
MDDETLMRPFDQWRHATHIRVAWNYLRRHAYPEALGRIRRGIKAYNAHNNVAETELFGFHETITEAWMRVVADVIARHGAGPDSESFLKENPHVGSRTLLRCYYSRERLVTPEAKQRFVLPDRAPLPWPPGQSKVAAGARRATPADLCALFELNAGLGRDDRGTARAFRALADGTLLVAREGERVVGYLMMDYQFFDRAFVDYLTVAPNARRRGHGLALMRAAIDLCESTKLFTSTNRSNEPMQALLGRLGFTQCGEVNELDPGDPEWFFVLHKEKP